MPKYNEQYFEIPKGFLKLIYKLSPQAIAVYTVLCKFQHERLRTDKDKKQANFKTLDYGIFKMSGKQQESWFILDNKTLLEWTKLKKSKLYEVKNELKGHELIKIKKRHLMKKKFKNGKSSIEWVAHKKSCCYKLPKLS